MEQLISYLYRKYVSGSDPNLHKLCRLEPISPSQLSQAQIESYFPSIAKNFLNYSAAQMQLRLSLPHLLMFLRLQKMTKILCPHLSHSSRDKDVIMHYFRQWIHNEFLPVRLNPKKKLPNSKYVYMEEPLKQEHGNQEQKDLKGGRKKSEQQLVHQLLTFNIPELTRHMLYGQISALVDVPVDQIEKLAQNTANPQEYEQLISKSQWMAIEHYITQRYGGSQDTLMVFNFISKYPFIEEKQLLQRTMLPVVEVRKSVDVLVADGLVNFYPENARTMLLRTIKRQQLNQIVKNHIAHSLLNLYMLLDSERDKVQQASKQAIEQFRQRQLQYLGMMSKLDESLILFC